MLIPSLVDLRLNTADNNTFIGNTVKVNGSTSGNNGLLLTNADVLAEHEINMSVHIAERSKD